MPEPDPINSPSWSHSPTNASRISTSPSRDSFTADTLSSNTSISSAGLYPSGQNQVPSLVPPPVGQERRSTKSIFQWGIPAELLPPMPVPLDSISGLTLGDAGQLTMNLNLPEASEQPRMKFSVEQITVADLEQPVEIWSLSSLARWIYELVVSFDAEFSVHDVHQLLTRLFMFRMKNLRWDLADSLAHSAVESLIRQQFISDASDILYLSSSGPEVSGVITDLTGDEWACYSYGPHDPQMMCYASKCLQRLSSRPLPSSSMHTTKATLGNLAPAPTVTGTTVFSSSSIDKPFEPMTSMDLEAVLDPNTTLEMNWRRFWNLEEVDIQDVDPKLVKLQFAIHELIMSEVSFVRDLVTYLDVYGEIELLKGLSVMSNQEQFCARVFGRIRSILAQNKHLLIQMLERQASQGPYIYDIADIITKWAKNSRTIQAYGDYAEDYLWTENHLRQELAKSTRLQNWMEERAKDPRINGKPHSFFFHRVLPRLARYQLLLSAVLKYTSEETVSERQSVQRAIETTTDLTRQCDDRVAKQKRVLDVQNLKAHIVFKSTAVTADLKLGDKRRKLIRRGDMVRKGDMKMDWVDTHTLLLDNFLVLSKTREGLNGTAFYVTKAPIPLDLLVLESDSEEGVVKVSSRLTLTRHGPTEEPDPSAVDNERSPVLYPLKITHLGSNGQKYLLFIPNKPERSQWARAIVEAKQSRAQLAFARSAEPFRFAQISDGFSYPESEAPYLSVPIPDTPLFRAVTSTNPEDGSRVILRRKVNCLVPVGAAYLLGTDYGLWLGHENQWMRVLNSPQRVLKLQVLETMNAVFVVCGDHNLSWYPLDQIIARGLGDKRHVLGTRLNRQRKVIDFSVSFHCGRVVLMYMQQGGILKVIEPIKSHGLIAMDTIEKAGIDRPSSCIDSFRELDKLQLSSDVTRVIPLIKSVILTTSKYFEWVTIDAKQTVKLPVGSAITKEMQYYGRPIRMIKLDASHFLKCFESCYVICDYEGKDCIQPTTWFLEKISDCAFYAPYLILFSQGGEMIEIRYVEEFPGRLVQLITGKDIKLLSNDDECVYFRMAHPWIVGRQLILQMIGNEIVRDTGSSWQSSST